MDYLAPSILRLFHGGRGKCQEQAFVSVDPKGRYYAVIWSSDSNRCEEWRGHVEVYDILEQRLIVNRHCRTPEVSVDGDFFNVCFLDANFGYGYRSHVLLSTPKGKCTIHDLSAEGAIRFTLSASTFHAFGEVAAEFFELPDTTPALVTSDSGECKLKYISDPRANGPCGLAIWKLSSEGDCNILDPGNHVTGSSNIGISCGGTRLLRSITVNPYETWIEVWNTINGTRVTRLWGDEFWLSPGMEGHLVYTASYRSEERLVWTSVKHEEKAESAFSDNVPQFRRYLKLIHGPDKEFLSWTSIHAQPIHSICGRRHGRNGNLYDLVTIDEDSVMTRWDTTHPKGKDPVGVRWVVTGGQRVFARRIRRTYKLKSTDINAEIQAAGSLAMDYGGRSPYLISCIQILPLGSFVLAVYAQSINPGGGKWHGKKHRYIIMLHSLATGELTLQIPF
eukprot:CAMPEP_0184503328 /NCGR_PEP_ID=MMETSP0113_2-20130426/51830_1 /TAXON_ID=91329 /ORGANISM="Norrisiella sphaerica, Strain BC52" /LENGTH=448 /DNA_ID=CAMNT_0026892811 /DNA_START=622 /DNA_END=1968 /DNA_ORIENTATION=+